MDFPCCFCTKENTNYLPQHSRQMLLGVGTPGRYFESGSRRLYWDRYEDLDDSSLHNRGEGDGPRLHDPPYVQIAFEMRRALALVRAKGESFELKYTKLPWSGTPKDWLSYKGTQVILQEHAAAGKQICKENGATCAENEIALLPAPPGWLASILIPYIMPLLPGDDTEIHCTT
eukprot:gnl/MRDRNA2_/MRDRNA2_53466_c0_seq2.p1 gnl/MRDRNA2_/MRDRNA2_53466_c0~~gnl/MRDRNA2_/MRDRNA2_53466_c0_seq2.p1  ORF type:complete len:174 (+),score=17.53 gnl/MRDRNA2_/MRDRNA2_53466_c0_seq2:34-555(+)